MDNTVGFYPTNRGSIPLGETKVMEVWSNLTASAINNLKRCCMKINETLEKAYGNMPKEPLPNFDFFDWFPTVRGFKYYWLKLIRKIKVRNFNRE